MGLSYLQINNFKSVNPSICITLKSCMNFYMNFFFHVEKDVCPPMHKQCMVIRLQKRILSDHHLKIQKSRKLWVKMVNLLSSILTLRHWMYESPQKTEQSINESLLKLIDHNNYQIDQRSFLDTKLESYRKWISKQEWLILIS